MTPFQQTRPRASLPRRGAETPHQPRSLASRTDDTHLLSELVRRGRPLPPLPRLVFISSSVSVSCSEWLDDPTEPDRTMRTLSAIAFCIPRAQPTSCPITGGCPCNYRSPFRTAGFAGKPFSRLGTNLSLRHDGGPAVSLGTGLFLLYSAGVRDPRLGKDAARGPPVLSQCRVSVAYAARALRLVLPSGHPQRVSGIARWLSAPRVSPHCRVSPV